MNGEMRDVQEGGVCFYMGWYVCGEMGRVGGKRFDSNLW